MDYQKVLLKWDAKYKHEDIMLIDDYKAVASMRREGYHRTVFASPSLNENKIYAIDFKVTEGLKCKIGINVGDI